MSGPPLVSQGPPVFKALSRPQESAHDVLQCRREDDVAVACCFFEQPSLPVQPNSVVKRIPCLVKPEGPD